MKIQQKFKPYLLSITGAGAAVVLAGCGGMPVSPAQTALACADLNGRVIPAASIGLPTNGALVTAATTVAAAGSGVAAVGEYCKLFGEIKSVDAAAPPITFELNLPTTWNQKSLHFGGGAFEGPLIGGMPSGLLNVFGAPATAPSPISRGYATYGSDSGHPVASPVFGNKGASFALNDEALKNQASAHLKKTHDVAAVLIRLRYGIAPTKNYFWGGSTGGRSALTVAQKWPLDYDGVVSFFPAVNAVPLYLAFGKMARSLAAPGGYLGNSKRKVVYDAAIAACDGLDGLKDGIIGNVAACNAFFDPATATVDGTPAGKPVRCAAGADTGDDCLSDAQIKTMKTINSPIKFNFPLASGATGFPGFNAWGTDFGFGAASDNPSVAANMGITFNTAPPALPATPAMPFSLIFWDQWVKYFVTRDANFNSLALDPENPGASASRISDLSALQDAIDPDLSAFRKRGGKMLILHGTTDGVVSSRGTDQYFESVKAKLGGESVATFARYLSVPGYSHTLGRAFNLRWDSVSALENWVEKGIAPNAEVGTDSSGVPGRARPLCDYPTWPRYNGSGDVNLAASFTCATQSIKN